MTTDSLLRRTGSLQIARSLMIAGSWVFAVARLPRPRVAYRDRRRFRSSSMSRVRPHQVCKDSPLEQAGFELVWGFSCQVVVLGFAESSLFGGVSR